MLTEFKHIDVRIEPYEVAVRFVSVLSNCEFPSSTIYSTQVKRLVGLNAVNIDWSPNPQQDLTEERFNRDVSLYLDPNGAIVGMNIRRVSDYFSPLELDIISMQSGELVAI